METPPPPILRDLPDELLGPRVLVRPLRPGDGAAVWEAVEESREQISPWLPWVAKTLGPDDCEAAARRGAARWQAREDLMVSIWEQATGRYLGGSGLHRIDWGVPAFEIGYWLRTSAWGRGYISETVRVLCRFAFETLGANRVEVRCDGRNLRSIAVPRRLGFVEEGRLRNNCRDAVGELRDTLIFALTPEDYARAREQWSRAVLQPDLLRAVDTTAGFTLTLEETPSHEDTETLRAILRDYNRQFVGESGYRALTVLLRDDQRQVVGGLIGSTHRGWLKVEVLAVGEEFRGQGHGRRLLQAAEREALARGCRRSWVGTYSFQARPFYERQGYRVFATLEDYPEGYRGFFLCKELPDLKEMGE